MRSFEAGVTKLLSTGANVTASYSLTRTKTNLVFQTLNPSYFNNFIVDFRQPFLQGFGIDFTRSEIEKNKLERDNTIQLISREIQDIIYDTEVAYWQLMAARRAFTISARLIAWLEWIDYIAQERKYDIVQAGLSSIKAIIKARRAQFVELSSELRNAEDNLKSKINDPDLNLSQDIEIIPTEPFAVVPLILDQVGEVSDALMNNPELRSAKLEIEKAKIDVGVAKNQALPRLDAVFRYIIDGLGGNADRAFSQLSESDFQEYFISVEFEWPIGNRGPEAVLRAARLTLAQAIAKHRASIENLINSVYQVIRLLQSNFEQVKLQRDATYYAKTRRYHTRTRTYLYGSVTDLEFMLSTHTGLADIRSELLNTITNYQISLINLERTKGTLLRYNNISLRGADDQYYQKPYRPIGP
ncbi:MAG: TolC family protein [Planctomycetota bacterium]|nr:MAG: TolC family protein [Planctomycetota bacterium]